MLVGAAVLYSHMHTRMSGSHRLTVACFFVLGLVFECFLCILGSNTEGNNAAYCDRCYHGRSGPSVNVSVTLLHLLRLLIMAETLMWSQVTFCRTGAPIPYGNGRFWDQNPTTCSRAATWSLKSAKVPFLNTWSLKSLFLKNGP